MNPNFWRRNPTLTKLKTNKKFQFFLGQSGQSSSYNKESLAQAFVQFLEKESQPKPVAADLLAIHDKDEVPQTNLEHQQSQQSPQPPKEKPTVAVQPILLNEGILQQAYVQQRSSSAILKDVLSDL